MARISASRIPSSWQLAEALASHPGLTVVPHAGSEVRLAGELQVDHEGPPYDLHIVASYEVEIRIPLAFPRELPLAYETGAKIRRDFHRLRGGALCLGSPVGQRVHLGETPTIGRFIDRVIIPYLYGHAHLQQVGSMPFGELDHGVAGLEDEVRQIIGVPRDLPVIDVLRLAAVRRRHANKRPCPCGSGRRLGRCHHALTNFARAMLGRPACLEQVMHIEQQRALEAEVR